MAFVHEDSCKCLMSELDLFSVPPTQTSIENGTSSNTYPYRATLETLLSYGGDAKKSQLTSALYYRDQADRMDSVVFSDRVFSVAV